VFGDRWIAVRSGLTSDTGLLPRARLRPFGNRVDPSIQYGLDGEAHGYVSRAVENLKDLVANQTTEFAPGPLFGNEFNPAVAGVAFGAGDVGLLHVLDMRLRLDRSSPVPSSVGLALAPAPNCDHPAGPSAPFSDKWLNSKPTSRDGTGEATISEATHMLAEKFILLLETVISRTYPDGSPRIVSASRHVPIKLPNESGK
jgi:hypothetical protein